MAPLRGLVPTVCPQEGLFVVGELGLQQWIRRDRCLVALVAPDVSDSVGLAEAQAVPARVAHCMETVLVGWDLNRRGLWACLLWIGGIVVAQAQPWLEPGNIFLRDDIQTLSDAGIIRGPVQVWPLAWGDIAADLDQANSVVLDEAVTGALARVRAKAREAQDSDYLRTDIRAAAALKPRVIRTFEDTPREKGELELSLGWTGDRFSFKADATVVADASDGESLRPDGSYLGMALGNWMVSAGYQERWWGPGWEGSQILGTNARPFPHLAIQRNHSTPFESKWLSWIGPWNLVSFIGLLDDERVITDAQILGLRASFRPDVPGLGGLEIGLSRTAQLCGEDRPCDFDTYMNMLFGRDNRGDNVDPADEPGNQLGAIDARWASPIGHLPYALYFQWGAEDGRAGPSPVGSFLRQLGAEVWGNVFSTGWRHRTHLEFSETICTDGGIGGSGNQWNCAYNHSIYQTGYRYQGRVMGNGIDGDGRSYSVGSTLQGIGGGSWQLLLRHVDINIDGGDDPAHSLSAGPNKLDELAVSHEREAFGGTLSIGAGYSRLDSPLLLGDGDGFNAFVQWKTGF